MINNSKNKTSPRHATTHPRQVTVKITDLSRSSSNKCSKLANPNIWTARLDGDGKIRIIYFHGYLQIEMDIRKGESVSTAVIARFSPHYAVEIERMPLEGAKRKEALLLIQQKGIHNFADNAITRESNSKQTVSDNTLSDWFQLHRKHYQLLHLRGVAGCKASFEATTSRYRGIGI